MPLPIKPYSDIVTLEVQEIQSNSSKIFGFNVGSTTLAIVEATANAVLLLQAQASYLMQIARFLTSEGADADSWGAQFGYYRLPASPAQADCTLSRTSTTTLTTIPVGNQVSTQTGVTFNVIADLNNPNYNPSTNRYTIGIGISSISVPVQCTVTGPDGNVGANTITVINTPIPTVTGVTNASQASGGAPQESDDAYKSRFVNFLAYQAKGTTDAIEFAVASVQSGAYCKVNERKLPDGTTEPGVNTIVVDDGTGSTGALPSSFIDACTAACEAVRSCGIEYVVQGRTLTDIPIEATVIVESYVNTAEAAAQISASLSSYIAQLQIGSTVYYTRIINVIYNAISGIIDVTGVTVNGSTSDVTTNNYHAPRTITDPVINAEYE